MNPLHSIYKKIFHNIVWELENFLKGCNTVLDLGCGYPSQLKSVKKTFVSTGVDIFEPYIEKSKMEKIHDNYIIADVRNINKKFPKKSFDCVVALDLIEHFTKREGLKLIKKMEDVALKKVIIFTPNGFAPQESRDGNPYQEHKSGWLTNDMESLGYSVIGINGWKPLRRERAEIRFAPKIFWRIISDMTQFYTRTHPESAHQILCIKNLD